MFMQSLHYNGEPMIGVNTHTWALNTTENTTSHFDLFCFIFYILIISKFHDSCVYG